ncbi:hypothetical protein [Mycolicibacterium fortuitum]|uniref:hypothetical protein n=1 Tax=Mycolicibacterium fortuitum TaxID=1766 RepID=UPI0026154A72|nr:hypothetical protein [Mycolicibacterium fortuitum]
MTTANPFIGQLDYFDRRIAAMWFTGGDRAFHTHGDMEGAEGIWNAAKQVQGIYDAPVKTTYTTGVSEDGSTQKAVKRLHRDMTLGFHCVDTDGRAMEENESEFRKIFGYEVDEWDDDPQPTTLHIKTDMSGERMLDVLMHKDPVIEADYDPIKQQHINLILNLRAGQPNWYEIPTEANGGKSVFQDGGTEAEGFIEVYNPTDLVCKQMWILTRATWQIPDVSWRGGKYKRRPGGYYANRSLPVGPITELHGGVVINYDTSKHLMVRDAHGTNFLPRMGGKFFMHEIPPYTPRQLLPISYTDAPAGGARAELIMPRRWSRPWGLE